MLHSAHKRGVQKGYPLNIEAEKTEIVKQEMNEMFLKNRLPKLDWNCFIVGCKSVGITDIPSSFNNNLLNNRQFLEKCHHALLEIHIIDGNLICPESQRKFPIRDGIPNMLLREDELPNINDNDLLNVYEVKKNKKKQNKNNLNDNENESKEQELLSINNDSTSNSNNKLNPNPSSSPSNGNNLNEINNGNNNGNVKLINNGNTSGSSSGDNPYLDPLLMKGLQQFTPKANTTFVKSHTVDKQDNNNIDNDTNCNDDNDIIMT